MQYYNVLQSDWKVTCFFSFYQDKIVPADPITSFEKTKTLRRLDQVIQHRLVTSKLPSEMGSLIVGECFKIVLNFLKSIGQIQGCM